MNNSMKQAALETLQQKTTVAMTTSGVATVTTSFVDDIQPWIPVIGIVATILFGIANTIINYKRYKREKHESD